MYQHIPNTLNTCSNFLSVSFTYEWFPILEAISHKVFWSLPTFGYTLWTGRSSVVGGACSRSSITAIIVPLLTNSHIACCRNHAPTYVYILGLGLPFKKFYEAYPPGRKSVCPLYSFNGLHEFIMIHTFLLEDTAPVVQLANRIGRGNPRILSNGVYVHIHVAHFRSEYWHGKYTRYIYIYRVTIIKHFRIEQLI